MDGLTALAFLVMVAVLFPFGVGAQTEQLRAIGPGVLWIAVLLANLLALPRLFEPDQHNASQFFDRYVHVHCLPWIK